MIASCTPPMSLPTCWNTCLVVWGGGDVRARGMHIGSWPRYRNYQRHDPGSLGDWKLIWLHVQTWVYTNLMGWIVWREVWCQGMDGSPLQQMLAQHSFGESSPWMEFPWMGNYVTTYTILEEFYSSLPGSQIPRISITAWIRPFRGKNTFFLSNFFWQTNLEEWVYF